MEIPFAWPDGGSPLDLLQSFQNDRARVPRALIRACAAELLALDLAADAELVRRSAPKKSATLLDSAIAHRARAAELLAEAGYRLSLVAVPPAKLRGPCVDLRASKPARWRNVK